MRLAIWTFRDAEKREGAGCWEDAAGIAQTPFKEVPCRRIAAESGRTAIASAAAKLLDDEIGVGDRTATTRTTRSRREALNLSVT